MARVANFGFRFPPLLLKTDCNVESVKCLNREEASNPFVLFMTQLDSSSHNPKYFLSRMDLVEPRDLHCQTFDLPKLSKIYTTTKKKETMMLNVQVLY